MTFSEEGIRSVDVVVTDHIELYLGDAEVIFNNFKADREQERDQQKCGGNRL